MATTQQIKASSALMQLGSYSNELQKQVKSTKGVNSEVLAEWIDAFFSAARGMGVTSQTLEHAIRSTHPQGSTQVPQKA